MQAEETEILPTRANGVKFAPASRSPAAPHDAVLALSSALVALSRAALAVPLLSTHSHLLSATASLLSLNASLVLLAVAVALRARAPAIAPALLSLAVPVGCLGSAAFAGAVTLTSSYRVLELRACANVALGAVALTHVAFVVANASLRSRTPGLNRLLGGGPVVDTSLPGLKIEMEALLAYDIVVVLVSAAAASLECELPGKAGLIDKVGALTVTGMSIVLVRRFRRLQAIKISCDGWEDEGRMKSEVLPNMSSNILP